MTIEQDIFEVEVSSVSDSITGIVTLESISLPAAAGLRDIVNQQLVSLETKYLGEEKVIALRQRFDSLRRLS